VTVVRLLGGTWLRLRFDEGRQLELKPVLKGAVFAPLRDPAVLAQVAVDPDTRAVAWPSGADFAPKFLATLLGQRTAA
jgi:hypothetical protein